jgi:hypothetical protein
MLVEDMSRNKCIFQVRISHVLYPFVAYLLTLPGTFHWHRGEKPLPPNPAESSKIAVWMLIQLHLLHTLYNPTLRGHILALSRLWLTQH